MVLAVRVMAMVVGKRAMIVQTAAETKILDLQAPIRGQLSVEFVAQHFHYYREEIFSLLLHAPSSSQTQNAAAAHSIVATIFE
jgi:hypothetical protein